MTDPVHTSAEGVKRLKILVQLRKLYRNLLRAERLLATSSPVHQKPEEVKPAKGSSADNSGHGKFVLLLIRLSGMMS